MNLKMICRILDRRAIIIYLSAIFLLILTHVGKRITVVELFGGINSSIGTLNLLEILRWNICALPPIAISTLFMQSELGFLSIYTIIRSKSIKKWCLSRYMVIVIANLTYTIFVVLVALILNLNIDFFNGSLYRLILIFSLHTTMMSLLSATLLSIYKNTTAVFLLFFFIEGCGVVIGSILPSTAKYIIPFWGMVQNKSFLLSNEYYHLLITSGVMLMVIASCFTITITQLNKYNPAANYRNL